VQLNLNVNASFADLSQLTPELKAQLTKKEQAVFAELGDTISASGQWNTGLGQLGVYATPTGLERIAASANIKSFARSAADAMRLRFYDDSGKLLQAIESEIDKNGYADVETVLNIDNFNFDVTPDGKTVHRVSPEQKAEMLSKLPAFLNALPPKHVQNLDTLKSQIEQTANQPSLSLRVDREGLYALIDNEAIRALRLLNPPSEEPVRLDPKALAAAKKAGFAGVIISLRQPFGYSPQSGYLPAKAWEAQAVTLRTLFDAIFKSLGKDNVSDVDPFTGLPGAYARLSQAALEKLYQNPDPRIQSISLNTGIAGLAVNQGAAFLNMPAIWNPNPNINPPRGAVTGAGQNVVVMDSAFRKDHTFLNQTASGPSKVWYEACFGADVGTTEGTTKYTSLCTNQQGTTGDSPLGMVNSAAYTICNGVAGAGNLCFHGTAVAGVAAGRHNWNYGGVNFSGIAPDANIIGVSVMSMQQKATGVKQLWGVRKDIIDALIALNANGASNMTANLSIGDQTPNTGDCILNEYNVNAAVSQMVSKKIPVIVATGNSYWHGNNGAAKAIEWPSCIPNVIKVAALKNLAETLPANSGGTPPPATENALIQNNRDEIAPYSNLVEQTSVNGQIYLAPGCAFTSHSNASTAGTWACGTSIAAPYVTGFFAVAKSAFPTMPLPDLIALINTSAAVNVTVPGFSDPFKRIKILL
jgi:hypothetical protein